MADFAAISSILSSVKTATDIAKLLKDSDLSLEKAEMKLKLADLITALADAKIEVSDIQSSISEKDKIIKVLEEKLEIKQKMKFEQPYYWLINDNKKEGPFCQHCYDKDSKTIRLQGDGAGYWECRVCRNGYTDNSYVPQDSNSGGWDAFV